MAAPPMSSSASSAPNLAAAARADTFADVDLLNVSDNPPPPRLSSQSIVVGGGQQQQQLASPASASAHSSASSPHNNNNNNNNGSFATTGNRNNSIASMNSGRHDRSTSSVHRHNSLASVGGGGGVATVAANIPLTATIMNPSLEDDDDDTIHLPTTAAQQQQQAMMSIAAAATSASSPASPASPPVIVGDSDSAGTTASLTDDDDDDVETNNNDVMLDDDDIDLDLDDIDEALMPLAKKQSASSPKLASSAGSGMTAFDTLSPLLDATARGDSNSNNNSSSNVIAGAANAAAATSSRNNAIGGYASGGLPPGLSESAALIAADLSAADFAELDNRQHFYNEEIKSLQRGKLVGKGNFGNVYMARSARDKVYAVKQVRIASDDTTAIKTCKREVELMVRLPAHRNCVRYVGSRVSTRHFSIVMEYVRGGNIAAALTPGVPMPEPRAAVIIRDVLCGLVHLTKYNIVHQDIKGANVLLSGKGGCAKIADFGCARDISRLTQAAVGGGGTPMWMAPEVCTGAVADHRADIWSLGCLVLEMLNPAHVPWPNFQHGISLFAVLYAIGSATQPPPFPPGISVECREFLTRCLAVDPADRDSADELLELPWMADVSQVPLELTSDDDDDDVVMRSGGDDDDDEALLGRAGGGGGGGGGGGVGASNTGDNKQQQQQQQQYTNARMRAASGASAASGGGGRGGAATTPGGGDGDAATTTNNSHDDSSNTGHDTDLDEVLNSCNNLPVAARSLDYAQGLRLQDSSTQSPSTSLSQPVLDSAGIIIRGGGGSGGGGATTQYHQTSSSSPLIASSSSPTGGGVVSGSSQHAVVIAGTVGDGGGMMGVAVNNSGNNTRNGSHHVVVNQPAVPSGPALVVFSSSGKDKVESTPHHHVVAAAPPL